MTTNIAQLEEQAKERFQRNDFEGAKRLLEQALENIKSSGIHDLDRIARILNNIGFTYREMQDYQQAEQYFLHSVRILRKIGNPNNPELANTLQNLGRMAQYRRDYDTVWECWAEALEIWKRFIRGEEQAGYVPYLASCLSALGEYFADIEKYEYARQNFEQALELREGSLPSGHADIAENLYFLGMLCSTMGDLESSRTYFKRAIPMYIHELGPNHNWVQELRERLGSVELRLAKR